MLALLLPSPADSPHDAACHMTQAQAQADADTDAIRGGRVDECGAAARRHRRAVAVLFGSTARVRAGGGRCPAACLDDAGSVTTCWPVSRQ